MVKDCCKKDTEPKTADSSVKDENNIEEVGKDYNLVMLGLLIVLGALLVYNQLQINSFGDQISKLGSGSLSLASTSSATSSSSKSATLSESVVPTGTPEVYGSELGVSYDDVSPQDQQKANAAITKLGQLDQTIELEGDNLDRYISIVSQISCEYCCGADSIIFSSGKPACGCAHSYAMRGLAKYLIKDHGSEFTDDEILEELGKWKTLFFPGQITAKAKILKEQGIELNYINLASNKYRDIEKGASGSGMVGGC